MVKFSEMLPYVKYYFEENENQNELLFSDEVSIQYLIEVEQMGIIINTLKEDYLYDSAENSFYLIEDNGNIRLQTKLKGSLEQDGESYADHSNNSEDDSRSCDEDPYFIQDGESDAEDRNSSDYDSSWSYDEDSHFFQDKINCHVEDMDDGLYWEISSTDVPERFQRRTDPVTSTQTDGSHNPLIPDAELEEEAKWIYHNVFHYPFCLTLHKHDTENTKYPPYAEMDVIPNIYNALNLIRNKLFEVPFIWYYRREEVVPLNLQDLWRIFHWDGKWNHFVNKRNDLISRFEILAENEIAAAINGSQPSHRLPVFILERIRRIQFCEDYNDYMQYFLMYHGGEEHEFKSHFSSLEELKESANGIVIDDLHLENCDSFFRPDELNFGEHGEYYIEHKKQVFYRHQYELYRKSLANLIKKFGITADEHAQCIRNQFFMHPVVECDEDPMESAAPFISTTLTDSRKVLDAAVNVAGWELAYEPALRGKMREIFYDLAKLNVQVTPKGETIIDEKHNLYPFRNFKMKPVNDFISDQILQLKEGVENELIVITFSEQLYENDMHDFLWQIQSGYCLNQFSRDELKCPSIRIQWSKLREKAVFFAYEKILPELKRDVWNILVRRAKNFVSEMCCQKLFNWLRVAPYIPIDFSENCDEWNTSSGVRVMSIAYTRNSSNLSFGCCISADGTRCKFIRLPYLIMVYRPFDEAWEVNNNQLNFSKLKQFIIEEKPHIIVVGAESCEALMIVDNLKDIVKDLGEQFAKIKVDLIENDLAKVYAASRKADQDFADLNYPSLLREAISLGRRVQDPLAEFSQLCNMDYDIVNLNFHPSQHHLLEEELYSALVTEFINRVNEVGVDLNRTVTSPHMQNLVQFVCGFGPVKAYNLMQCMNKIDIPLKKRSDLLSFHIGLKIFMNCAGFVKIDNALSERNEVLDSTRIHPDAYDWVRKMAVVAMNYENYDNFADALKEILRNTERLELHFDVISTHLHANGFGKKDRTLSDIIQELIHPYKDFRQEYQSPSSEEIFYMLTKESSEMFFYGRHFQDTVNCNLTPLSLIYTFHNFCCSENISTWHF